ncbi:MAG: hypothetical protein D9N11_10660 [Ketobacter sp.]|nr:MAG: hypothetical protein D9N11_10660 [Ketobacter sp.]
MLWIEAALAFALTMTILSTVASVIIETGHRLGRTRERGLRQIAERLHQDVLAPLLPDRQRTDRTEFVKGLTRSCFYAPDRVPPLDKVINAPVLTALPEKDFVRRLASCAEGQALYARHQADRDTLSVLLQHIISRFNEIGQDASDYFKRRASLYSLAIGLLLAFSLNINTPHLFQTFLASKDARVTLSEQAKDLENWIANHNATSELEKAEIEELTPLLMDIKRNALPFGWHTAPWNQHQWETKNHAMELLKWVLSLSLSGLLIGLGGPFWFDTYRKLGALAGLHSGKTEAVTGGKSGQETQDWLTLFEQSIKASQLGIQSTNQIAD